jgi:hypothetical protein
VTTGSIKDPVPGALGQPGTGILLNDTLDQGGASGFRVSLNAALAGYGRLTGEANFFLTENRAGRFAASADGSAGSAVLARPFFNPNTGSQDADPVAIPGVDAGNIDVSATTRLMGAEANLRLNDPFTNPSGVRLSMLAGVRFLGLDDQLNINDSVHDLPLNQAPSQNFFFNDTFTTYNRFYGGQVGLEAEFRALQMSLGVQGKFAVGANRETVGTGASTLITDASGATIGVGSDRGLLVQPTNLGTVRRTRVSFVPEVALTYAIDFNRNARFFVGYTFLYWMNVARAGSQIDPTVSVQPVAPPGGASPPQLGVARPFLSPQDGAFWAQGLNVGLELRF